MLNKLLSEGRPWDCSNAEPGGNLPGHLKTDPILHRGETEAKFLFAFGHEVFSLSLPPACSRHDTPLGLHLPGTEMPVKPEQTLSCHKRIISYICCSS